MVAKGEAAAGEMPIHRSRQFRVMAGVAAGYSNELCKGPRSPDGLDKRRIEGFEAYSSKRDFDVCVERLQKVDLIAVALYPGAYPSVADLLAKTIAKRMETGLEEPLNVMFFVNMVFTARTFKKIAARTAG